MIIAMTVTAVTTMTVVTAVILTTMAVIAVIVEIKANVAKALIWKQASLAMMIMVKMAAMAATAVIPEATPETKKKMTVNSTFMVLIVGSVSKVALFVSMDTMLILTNVTLPVLQKVRISMETPVFHDNFE